MGTPGWTCLNKLGGPQRGRSFGHKLWKPCNFKPAAFQKCRSASMHCWPWASARRRCAATKFGWARNLSIVSAWTSQTSSMRRTSVQHPILFEHPVNTSQASVWYPLALEGDSSSNVLALQSSCTSRWRRASNLLRNCFPNRPQSPAAGTLQGIKVGFEPCQWFCNLFSSVIQFRPGTLPATKSQSSWNASPSLSARSEPEQEIPMGSKMPKVGQVGTRAQLYPRPPRQDELGRCCWILFGCSVQNLTLVGGCLHWPCGLDLWEKCHPEVGDVASSCIFKMPNGQCRDPAGGKLEHGKITYIYNIIYEDMHR